MLALVKDGSFASKLYNVHGWLPVVAVAPKCHPLDADFEFIDHENGILLEHPNGEYIWVHRDFIQEVAV